MKTLKRNIAIIELRNLADLRKKRSGLLDSYPDEMRKIQNTYAATKNIDDKTAYLFFIEGETENKGRDYSGYMPRNKQFGYIFTGSFTGNDEMHLAVAHELGHGQFVLKHTFDKDYKLPQGKTDNLMDYTRGARHIAKWQWDLIHDPGVVMRVFERDKDAASRLIIIDKKHTALFNHVWDGLTFNWLTKSALSTADENVSFIGFTGTNIYGLAGLDVPVFQRINLLLYGLFGAQQYKISDSGFSSGDYTVNSLVSEEHIRSKD